MPEYFGDKEGLLISIFLVPFFARMFFNMIALVMRDRSLPSGLGQNPLFNRQDSDFILESLLRFWWPRKSGWNWAKILSNLSSLTFGLVLLIAIISMILDNF